MRRFLPLVILGLSIGLHGHAQESKFWGFLAQSSEWSTQYGVYSYQTVSPFDKTPLFTTSDYTFSAGCAWQNGYYYGMDYYKGGWFSGPSATLHKINTDTWQAEGEPLSLTLPDQINFVAIETAQATNGTTWGEFRTQDNNTYELGTVDYANMTRTTLSTTTRYYLALGISNDGFLYGIDTNDDLYRISTSTGEEVRVGNTGIKIGGEYTDPKDYATCGEIDPVSNEFYWPYYTGVYDDSVVMYKINLSTAAATKVGVLPQGDQIVGMVFPVLRAPEDAPAPAANITFDFADPALAGKVSFAAPDTTAGGHPLAGQINYKVETASGTLQGTVSPGTVASVDVAAKASGMLSVKITLSNDKGASLPASASRWVGYDIPEQPGGVKATLEDDTVATIRWDSPSKGLHEGFLGKMTYDVCRVVDNESTSIAEGVAATSVKDTLRIDGNKRVTYGVRAHNATQVGDYGYSDALVVGSAYSVPFEDKFDENTKRDFYTTIDANHDGITIFRHYTEAQFGGIIPEQDYHEMGYTALKAKEKADDWFVTPKIRLEAGAVYKFSVDAKSSSLMNDDEQIMEVRMGTGNSVAAMQLPVMSPLTITSSEVKTCLKEFTVSKSGTYHFGIHVMTEPGRESLYFTNILVAVASDPEAPDSVGLLRAVADPNGQLKATVHFVAPTKTNSGKTLGSLSRVEILRNGEVIASPTGIRPGEEVSFVDNSPKNGFNSYTVIPYNDKGNGRRAEVDSVYVGVDVPMPPSGLSIADTGDGFNFCWKPVAPIGANGHIVRPQDVAYRLQLLDDTYRPTEEIKDTIGLQAHYAINTDEGAQDLIRFGLMAHNAAGESGYTYGRTLIGAPYSLPFAESFATGTGHGINWMEGDGLFAITTAESSDQDAGCVAYTPDRMGATASFNLGKMSLQSAVHPRLSFMYCHLGSEDTIVVKAALPNGEECALDTIKGDDSKEGWEKTTVALDSLVGNRYFIPKFVVTANSGRTVCLDQILVRNPYDTDLALDIVAPDTVEAGVKTTLKVMVANQGLKPASGYRVDVLQGSTLIATVQSVVPLQPDETSTYELSPVIDGHDGESVILKAQLFCPKDVYPANDVATYVVYVDGTTRVGSVNAASAHPVDIYSVDGKLVRSHATSLGGLPQGVYILEGKTIRVR